ncbi:MAG: phosphoribosyltransferase [Campylobacteraceae bacterium]|nr:phosphoribosyltransferase [Campylobacteraceae bacterium]
MINYGFTEFEKDVKELTRLVKKEFEPEVLLAVARGGLTIGHFMANALKNRNLFVLNSIHYDDDKKLDTVEVFNIPDLSKYKRVLIVEDIIDSGESMVEILRILKDLYPEVEFKTATLFYKERALVKPDFTIKEAKDWIVFLWDIEI